MERHPRWVRRFLTEADLEAIAGAVAEAERATSAEIRIHLDHRCPGDPQVCAVRVFERLGMHRTAERNGVLIYVAIASRKLSVIGDRAIHERVGDEFWRRVVDTMVGHLRDERPRDGLVDAVRELAGVLQAHFPRRPDDENELTNEVSLGDR